MWVVDQLLRLTAGKPRGTNFFDQYPPRWWAPMVHIYGGPGHEAVYMTRILLSPQFGKGRQLYLHVFHKPDQDRDPHDHPFGFRTLPLNQGYWEDVFNTSQQCFTRLHAPRLVWSHRAAKHTHRVIDTDTNRWPLITLVWRGPSERKWGFWCHRDAARERWFVGAREYTAGGSDAISGGVSHQNVDGEDVLCPGAVRVWRHGRWRDGR